MKLNLDQFREFLTEAADHYERSAPTVTDYVNNLYARINSAPDSVVLAELVAVGFLHDCDEWEQPNYAANRLYKLAHRLGRDTTGLAGF